MITTPIRKKEEIKILKQHFLNLREYRNYALFVVGINTALRISDLLKLKWIDVYDFEKNVYLSHIYVTEQKTKKISCVALNNNCMEALSLLKSYEQPILKSDFIFFSGNNKSRPISRNRAYNIIKKAATCNHIEGNISCHSLRKTFGYHAWKSGAPSALIMQIYNHSHIEITKRYLSIDQDDKDELFLSINL